VDSDEKVMTGLRDAGNSGYVHLRARGNWILVLPSQAFAEHCWERR
jgi:hypothetical protein